MARPSFGWNRCDCAHNPINLPVTLSSGQSFRWRRDAEGIWWGVVGRSVVAARQEEGRPDSPLYWQTFPEPGRQDIIADYFRLDVEVTALYAEWIAMEPRILPAIAAFRGLRVLRQPPVECFFAFQCAACNTVVKIERSVRRLAERYGEPIETGLADAPFDFFAFPTLEALANADEAALRADLWGYRAPRVIALARHLLQLPPGWLESLRQAPYVQAKAELMGLFGVGAKLADCICLFALDKDEAVPVDTHVRQIACRLFLPELSGKTLTPRVYEAIADAFRARFGAYAGWAQQYLYFGQLHRVRDFLRE
ncbi:MAG TPA: DNA glycosylase [Chthonomonadaceae bacterium]|nr:DNA glycosylase [Chthonomonadaceae bacterium]